MTKIIIGEDCGNSPKNIFVQELTIAFGKGDIKFLLDHATEDIRWNMVGDRLFEGKAEFAKALEKMIKVPAAELTIDHIATHGKAGAADGKIKLENGKLLGFCDVYEFNSAKATAVKQITSYVIQIK